MASTLSRLSDIRRTDSTQQKSPPAGYSTSTAINRGDFVTINSSGLVALAAAASANITSGTRIAMAPQAVATTVTSGTVYPIEILTEDCVIRLPLTTAGATTTWNNNQLNKQYGIYNKGGIFCVDVSDVTNLVCEVVGVDPNTPSSDTFPAVLVKILPAYRLA